jgi:hypothetical protein
MVLYAFGMSPAAPAEQLPVSWIVELTTEFLWLCSRYVMICGITKVFR